MEQYTVTGMSCTVCSARVEKVAAKVSGVTLCSVSLLTNPIGVEGGVSSQEIVEAVRATGYDVAVRGKTASRSFTGDTDGMLKDRETPILKRRPYYSLGFLIVFMYFSTGHMMRNQPVPAFFMDNHVAMEFLQLLLTGIIMVVNQRFFIGGFKGLIYRAPNMDTLVTLGSGVSFVHNAYALFVMMDVQVSGDMASVTLYMYEFYFRSATMIPTLITVGKMLEARSKGRTTDALESPMKLALRIATLKMGSVETEVSIDQVKKEGIFVVQPGESTPVDGIVLGESNVMNESALMEESIPVGKGVDDQVSAATVNQSGYIVCKTFRVGEDTTLSQIIQMVSDTVVTKTPTARVADRVSGVFVPAMIAIAAMTVLVWLVAGESIGFALARGISVLVVSRPCVLRLAIPMAVMVGNGMGAKHGIMFKAAISLEETRKVGTVTLDKTGAITSGEPRVTDVVPAEGITKRQLLELAFSLEKRSEYPLVKAVLVKTGKLGIQVQEVGDFKALPGNGLSAVLEDRLLYDGNLTFISSQVQMTKEMKVQSERLTEKGKTPLFFSRDGVMVGIIAVAGTIKGGSPRAVKEPQDMGIHVVMLTGDNEHAARAMGRQAGVDGAIVGVLPDGKENAIRSLEKKGRVAMAGDGINDAPALTRTGIGIAIGAGTDIATDAADVALMKSHLRDVPVAVRMDRATLHNIHENLFWAFFYNAVGIPLAVGL